jgi:hypothetical protein
VILLNSIIGNLRVHREFDFSPLVDHLSSLTLRFRLENPFPPSNTFTSFDWTSFFAVDTCMIRDPALHTLYLRRCFATACLFSSHPLRTKPSEISKLDLDYPARPAANLRTITFLKLIQLSLVFFTSVVSCVA